MLEKYYAKMIDENMERVDHFYIYDNESEDDLKSVFSEYIREGIVTYHIARAYVNSK